MMDSRPPVFHGQQRQQRQQHPHDHQDEATHAFNQASSGNFLLPESQNGFTFSAEPGTIDDGSMVSLVPFPGSAQESAFAPNAGSSFDSHMRPDMINQTFPPPYFSMQSQQNYSLSPATHSRNGQSISPSHSVDHLSPEAAGYLSDPNSYSNYTTPNLGSQYLEDNFSSLTFTEPPMASTNYDPFQSNASLAMPITADVLATYNAQAPSLNPSNIPSQAQLISPSPTNNSSPVITDDHANTTGFSTMNFTSNDYQSSTPPAPMQHMMHSTPIKQGKRQQQQSPALTESPPYSTLAQQQSKPHLLTSPIVRVEHIDRAGSPSTSDISRPVSKRSHGSRRSGNHLSPFPVDDNDTSDEDVDPQAVRVQHPPVIRGAERNEDGSWVSGQGDGRGGLNPHDRDHMNGAWVPTLDELADHRLKEEKKLEVEEWLTKSEACSEAGDAGSSTNLLKPFTTRRRAKSTNDANRNGFAKGFGLGVRTDFELLDDSGIPGPGLYIDERSEYEDYDDEDDEDAEPESPAAEIDISASHADDSYFPPAAVEHGSLMSAIFRPWVDAPTQPTPTASSTRYQPQTSNAAMMRFGLRAKDVETASLAATLGSRRLSESDLGSIRAAPGVVKAIKPAEPVESEIKKQKERQRRPSFLENILPKRAPSNLLKRKGSIPVQTPTEVGGEKAKELVGIEKPKRMGSWGRPKSPRLDTNVATQVKELGPPSSTGLSATSGPWYQRPKNAIRRSRSRSDLGRSPGLKELMTQHGGPPMPMLASPLAETEATKLPNPSPGGDDDDDDDAQEAVTMDLKVRSDPIIPTYEGFKTHARQLNPRLVDYMVERITQEQMRRYKRLLEFKVKHLNAVKNHNCPSATFCTDLGGESKQLPPRAGNKDSDAPFIGFQITAPGSSDDDGEPLPEGTVVAAQFPSGVPLPPVKRLPAEFECPLCFKVKKFYKPSDWTKHVHEDVQPFTCTFPHCGEPKSFKRKADWVRHENERHRQLENWTCQIADCNHTCYRKDNFVQHLVREHKIAEPRARTGRGTKDTATASTSEDIWSLVERCRRDTTKQPRDEPCRFCGNICNSWKKLTVHLAKHMEQISMPILPLVEQKQMNADTIISPVVEMPESRKLSATPGKSPVDNPSRYIPNHSTFAPGIDPSRFPADPSPVGNAATTIHSYPPPQLMHIKAQHPSRNGNYNNYVLEGAPNMSGSTYPGLQEPAKMRGTYVNGLQIPNQNYQNGTAQNGANGFPMTPVSALGHHQTAGFTTSPIDTATFPSEALGPQYFTQEPQNLMNSSMAYDNGSPLRFNGSPYQDLSYMPQQHNYQYQGQ
ncbi:hypothetical protein BU24DRAFT_65382 [Aaosphaeria arxii CBS 175.79]|uniref:C2H2-type domain-containing protein n=1 Tax=Aaosphaeria arxii CBS 175.79 TaxID=1450172 RepID=A0A6A5XAF9_9PLEO|nr:uncharacterized protein BU24DRAFT_65382 [Aaosphaeria arxii CBS 175.79]KAF2009846.1 hypothetical protein BU24DRAFT_65382 [Aaosphaeria arxii CBS 175.79]